MPGLEGVFHIIHILGEETGRMAFLFRLDADFPGVTHCDLFAIRIQQNNFILRIGLTHTAGLRLDIGKSTDGHGGFRLTEPFVGNKSGDAGKGFAHFRRHGFPGGRHMLKRGEVVLGKIFLHQEAEDRRGRTECGDPVLLEHGQHIRRMETIKVIGENSCLAEPLSVQFSPDSLAPAGIRHREMDALGIDFVPVTGSHHVSQRIGVVMLHHFGITGGAGAEEDQHGIRTLQIFRTGKDRREVAVHGIIIHPAVPFAVDGQLPLQRGCLICHGIDRIANAVTGGTDNAFDFGFVDPVFDVMTEQLNRSGNNDSTQFVQSIHQIPELVVTADDQHHAVALPDTE